jgi:hypothetical protein
MMTTEHPLLDISTIPPSLVRSKRAPTLSTPKFRPVTLPPRRRKIGSIPAFVAPLLCRFPLMLSFDPICQLCPFRRCPFERSPI